MISQLIKVTIFKYIPEVPNENTTYNYKYSNNPINKIDFIVKCINCLLPFIFSAVGVLTIGR